jgi:acetyl-CoA carboxylase biotin carboxyl carrier protein
MAKFQPNVDLIRELAAVLDETGLNEIEYEAEGQRIKIGRGGGMVSAYAPAPQAAPAGPVPAAGSAADDASSALQNAVTAPMVGTIYTAPEPGADNFIKVGDTVTEGQTLFIIEAMKVMNPLASPRSGKITRILVKDTQPVEFGEPLVIIE